MARPIVVGTVKEEDIPRLLEELNKVGHFSLVKREDNVVTYYDGLMNHHKILIGDSTELAILR